MAKVQLRNVRKSFTSVNILEGVSVDIADGEFLILVGPSGCGKSTLLRMIAGLETVTSGDIMIGDKLVNQVPPKDRDIAMVFQNYALYPHKTVAQNMGFALKLAGRPKVEIDAHVKRAADILDLGTLLERFPKQLSGGQRQRVAMGRAIVRDPQVFLFDEPLSNLDAKLRVQMRAEIKALHQRLKTTTIYVTHDQIEAMTMADRIVVMHKGEISQMGTPMELFDRPANVFVASFIGSPTMNLFEGMVVEDAGKKAFRSNAGVTLPLGERAKDLATGRHVVYGIRPTHVHVAPGASAGSVAALVSVVEPTGSETELHLKLGAEPFVVQVHERIEAVPGQVLQLQIALEQVHLFDQQSGIRI